MIQDTRQGAPTGQPRLRRYALSELEKSVALERELSMLAKEKVDQLEIDKRFRANRRKPRPNVRGKSFLHLKTQPLPEPTAEQREVLDRVASSGNLQLLEQAVQDELFTRAQACRFWGDRIGIAVVDPFESIVTEEALACLPEDIARKTQSLPLYIVEDVLTVVMARPEDAAMRRRLAGISQKSLSAVFALPREIADAQDVFYSKNDDISRSIEVFEEKHGSLASNLEDLEVEELSESQPLVQILDALLHLALKERASDIHFEPQEGFCRVRFRIDGRLRTLLRLSPSVHKALCLRILVLSKLNISEFRFPQDGRFAIPLGLTKAEFRVSLRPTSHGSNVVLRILGSSGRAKLMTLDEMLISQNILQPFRKVIQNPNGMIYVTGPTGSGKTTTLYATLEEINSPDRNIATIEDPVEIDLPGISQSQVHGAIELNFATFLRSILRQDPDVILVGETRDLETAKIATEAALTGHLVLSTLHTNNALQAVVRLIELGVPAYMLAPSINAVLAQRLVPRLSDQHKEAYTPDPEVLNRFFDDCDGADITLYRPDPSLPEEHMAYKGRVSFHELVLVSEAMRTLIAAQASTHELAEAAQQIGYRPLRFDALKKVFLGLTSLDYVEKSTPAEWIQ